MLATGAVRDAVGRLPGVLGRVRHRAFKGVAESVPVYLVRSQ